MGKNKRQSNDSSGSEGDTKSPNRKTTNTMTTPTSTAGDNNEGGARPKQLTQGEPDIVAMFEELRRGQNSLKQTVESRIDRLRADIERSIDAKLSAFKNDVYLDMGRLESRIEKMEAEWRNAKAEMLVPHSSSAGVEQSVNDMAAESVLRSTEHCIIVHGIPYEMGEDLGHKISDMLTALGQEVREGVTVVAYKRLNQRIRGRTPLVKVALRTVDEKVAVLKAKANLKSNPMYRSVWIRKSESHTERLLRLNMKKLLDTLPNGNDYGFTGSGRLLRKSELSEFRNARKNTRDEEYDEWSDALDRPGTSGAGSSASGRSTASAGSATRNTGETEAAAGGDAAAGGGDEEQME